MDIKRDYKLLELKITSETLNKFELMVDRRMIRDSHVQKIHACLLKGENPMSTLTVNKKNGKFRLIDGNHRIEAVRRFYGYRKENLKIGIDCTLKVYENLSDDEERTLYGKEATRVNETHEDRLNIYKDTITFWKLIQDPLKEFPCKITIYNSKKSVRLRVILDAICSAKNQIDNGFVPRHLNKKDLVPFAQDLIYIDYLLIKNFMRIFIKVFGEANDRNQFIRMSGFLPLFDIYFRNLKDFQEDKVIERFKLVLGKGDILMYLNMNGREVFQTVRSLMVNYMNKGKTFSKNAVI